MSAEERIDITTKGSTIRECREKAKSSIDAFCFGESWRWGDVLYVPAQTISTTAGVSYIDSWEGHFTAWIIDEDAIERT